MKKIKHRFMRIMTVSMLCFMLCQPTAFAKEETINVTLNGAKLAFDQNPIIENGRTLVPLRKIFESLNAFVEWDEATQSVHAKKGATEISLTIDSNVAKVNGKEYLLDVPAKVLNGRTLVPARFVAESLNCKVDWNGDTSTVIINSVMHPVDEENLFDVNKVTYGRYIALNGKTYSNPIYNHSDLIKVTPGETIYFTEFRVPLQVRFVTAYDADKNAIEEFGADAVKQYTVPQGVEYIGITTYEKGTAHLKVSASTMVDGFIPEEICVAEGIQMTIYGSQLVSERRSDLAFSWECEAGNELNGNFVINGNNKVGEYPLKVSAKDSDGVNIWTGTSTVKIVKNQIPEMKILAIGDSLTNNKPWLLRFREYAQEKVDFVGTRKYVFKNKEGKYEAIYHEGRSGFSSGGYNKATEYTFEKEGVHPFWDGGRFNWNHYKETTGVEPDAVQIFLGTNSIQNSPVSNASNIIRMIDYIHNDEPDIPIFIVNTMYKGPLTDKAEHVKVFNLMEYLNNSLKDYDNVHIVPVAIIHDSENNYAENDQIHPKQEGFYQIADCIYSSFCAHMN